MPEASHDIEILDPPYEQGSRWERMDDPLMEVREADSPRQRLGAGAMADRRSGLVR
jgi:hypothetical protein